MKNIKFKFIASALASVLLVGCNDMDTEPMGSTITSEQKSETVASNPERIEATVSAVPAMANQFGNAIGTGYHNDFGYAAIMLWTDTRGMDFVSTSIGYNWFASAVTYSDISPTGVGTNLFWRTIYKQLYAANSLAKIVDPATEDNSLKFYLAQALATRAFDYFTLAQLYQHTYVGNESKPCVPLITDLNADEVASNGCPRATVEEVYAQIMTDLNTAITLLESSTKERDDKRYINAAVAYGLRARVNLVMNNWADAASDAQKAISLHDGQPYSIAEVSVPTFGDIEAPSWMWGVLIAETDDVVETGICNFPSHMGSLNYGYASVGAWRTISKSLYNSIPETDVRKGWWLNEKGLSANLNAEQQAYISSAALDDNKNPLPYIQVKYGCYNNETYTSVNANDIPLMRVEEMYLILAEAQAMSGNASAGAATLQNFVSTYRDPAYVCLASSPEGVQEAVWQQRRIELWGEGFSYADIMRLKKPIDRRGAGFEAAFVYNIPAGDPVLVYPIPNSEIEANPMLSHDTNPTLTAPSPVADN
ncbi:MAG: RagB/SusD family nutrient uptake outer membrane protein [Bacteroides sp.]|nr:RagB/SusD family nutrient uptake outer membrane protein [Bacteroides sp.]